MYILKWFLSEDSTMCECEGGSAPPPPDELSVTGLIPTIISVWSGAHWVTLCCQILVLIPSAYKVWKISFYNDWSIMSPLQYIRLYKLGGRECPQNRFIKCRHFCVTVLYILVFRLLSLIVTQCGALMQGRRQGDSAVTSQHWHSSHLSSW